MLLGTATPRRAAPTTLHLGSSRFEFSRLAIAAALVAVVADVLIGLAVANSARLDLLNARIAIHQGVVDELVSQGLLPLPGNLESYKALDDAVQLRLIGGETVRVKLWDLDGTVIYSDAKELIGTRFDLEDNAAQALAGVAGVEQGVLDAPENATEAGLGPLLEFYLPVRVDGEVTGVFEVYEESGTFNSSLSQIRRDVWTAVAIGLLAVVVAIGSVMRGHARSIDRRRRQAEELLGQSLTAGEEERRRIVGALHDDIGQPLYRVLYGLEGCHARSDTPELQEELARLQDLVREIDASLRSELRMLHAGLVEGDGLMEALQRMAEATRIESKIEVEVRGELAPGLSSAAATALFQAAQEAVINSRKHARPTSIVIDVRPQGRGLSIEIADDGRGWSGREGLGITTTRQRITALDGQFVVARRPGRGTIVNGWVPVDAAGTP